VPDRELNEVRAMPRLPYPSLDDLPAPAAAAIKAFPAPINAVRITAHAPTLLAPLLQLCTEVMTSLELTARHREMLLLLVAHETQCEYEWVQHLPQATAAGLTQDDIAAITDAAPRNLAPAEQVLLAAGRVHLAGEPFTDGILHDLRRHFSDRMVVEALFVLGYVRMFCSVINAVDLDIDPAGAAIAAGFARIQERAT
jgi:AhpD family alkylhydroperoxidase